MKKFMADQFTVFTGGHFVKKFIASAVMAIFCLVLGSAKPAWSAEIALYNPDTLATTATPTPVPILTNSAPGATIATALVQGSNGAPAVYGVTTTGYDTAFNGHNYISYNPGFPNGLLTSPLYTGSNPRTVAGVYDTPAYTSAQNGGWNAFIAGEAYNNPPVPNVNGSWFGLESRFAGVEGNPYLVTFGVGTDLSNNGQYPTAGNPPLAHQLQFALATYDPTVAGGTETLYWAYGVTGAVNSVSVSGISLNTIGSPLFTVGSAPNEASSPIDIGDVVVFDTALSSAQAIAEIEALQASYVPEPTSAVAFFGLGAIGLFMFARRRSGSRKPKLTALVITALLFVVLGSAGSASAQTAIYNPGDYAGGSVITTMNNDGSGGSADDLTGGPVTIVGALTPGYNPVFNGHNYGNYTSGITMATANALFTGNNARAVAAVYDTPTAPPLASPPGSGTFNAQIAGQTPASSAMHTAAWFGIESRDNNVTGDPYLVNYGPDINSGHAPVANQLTFAVATYDGAGTEDLYWAFGTTGAVQSAQVLTTLNTNFNGSTDTNSPFTLGTSADGNSASQIGAVLVFNSGLDSEDAMAVIEGLQAAYVATPEPSSVVALCGLGAMGLFVLVRRRRKA